MRLNLSGFNPRNRDFRFHILVTWELVAMQCHSLKKCILVSKPRSPGCLATPSDIVMGSNSHLFDMVFEPCLVPWVVQVVHQSWS
uniref:Uncharacterized protein n=1 Tax=Physcomitrium patens TaxID=3218 RepID=A0A2K1KFJ7_PHYPA|nr:hypothetical protein PHYPA_008930 [Physcomitrium patens]